MDNNDKYTCPQCGKIRPYNPDDYNVGDIVCVNITTQTTTRSANRVMITCKAAGYDGIVKEIRADGNTVVQRGTKGYGKTSIVSITALTPRDAPGILAYIELGRCQCNQQPTTQQ